MGRHNRHPTAANLERLLVELDLTVYGTDRIDIRRINGIIRERTRGAWAESRLRYLLVGDVKLTVDDVIRISTALQVDANRILFELPPRKARRRPESIWEEPDMSLG